MESCLDVHLYDDRVLDARDGGEEVGEGDGLCWGAHHLLLTHLAIFTSPIYNGSMKEARPYLGLCNKHDGAGVGPGVPVRTGVQPHGVERRWFVAGSSG